MWIVEKTVHVSSPTIHDSKKCAGQIEMNIRTATINDLPAIIHLIADDFLGQKRERITDPISEDYVKAFRQIDADANNELIVAELDGDIVGTFQLTYTPSLSFHGGKRSTIESVRVDEKFRGRGIGEEMMIWAMQRAKGKGCVSMQLTSHNDRKDAHRFYEKLGFKRSHTGMKIRFDKAP
jgi:GNAT superfamily N-acetyltransferase